MSLSFNCKPLLCSNLFAKKFKALFILNLLHIKIFIVNLFYQYDFLIIHLYKIIIKLLVLDMFLL